MGRSSETLLGQGFGRRLEIAHGISEDTTKQIKYLPGEGIIGKVIQTGKPAVVSYNFV